MEITLQTNVDFFGNVIVLKPEIAITRMQKPCKMHVKLEWVD